jgi:ribonuclease P/MRP protein subunit POP7
MSDSRPFDVSAELAKLRHEKKNGQMLKLPQNATVQKRPIIHSEVASPYAGVGVQKAVYISSKSPFMSTVKRVKKLLLHIEKRATQNVKLVERGTKEEMRKLADASDKIAKDREEVIVKASGKAIPKAMNVAEWFSSKEKDMSCKVEIRSGNVSVVDDIVELTDPADEEADEHEHPDQRSTLLDAGDTTMELFGHQPDAATATRTETQQNSEKENEDASAEFDSNKKKRRRRKRQRPSYDADDLPEQRLRWVKTVEVAISLEG